MAKILIPCIAGLALTGVMPAPPALQAKAEMQRAIAQRRVSDLRKLSSGELAKEATAFDFLVLNGLYGAGREAGWAATFLRDPIQPRELMIAHTPTSAQDIGSQVFEVRGGKLVRKLAESDRQGARIVHHDLDLTLDPPRMMLTATDRITFERTGENSGSLILRLGSHLSVTKVADGRGNLLAFSKGGGVLVVPTPTSGDPVLQIEYSGLINLPFIGGMTRQDEMSLSGDLFYPTLGRWPATHTTRITYPKGWVAICQGEATPASVTGETQTQTFRMAVPNSFFSLSVGKYRERSLTSGGFTVRTVSPGMKEADMDLNNRVNGDVLRYLNRFAPNPFREFTFVESRCTFNGALEAYNHATYGEGWLPAEEPHEPSHTWFGGIVPNTYLSSLWNESFAMWFESHYKRENRICPPAEARRAFIAPPQASQAFNRFPLVRAGSEQGSDAEALGYEKGSYVLTMLESLIGPDKMVTAVQEFFRQARSGVPAEWSDFEACVAPEYKWFFDQWLRRAGSPHFKLGAATWSAGQLRVKLTWVGPSYRLPTEALLRFPTSPEQVVRVVIPSTGDLVIPVATKPSTLTLDPLSRLLRVRNAAGDFPESLARFVGRAKRYVAPGMGATESVVADRARIGQKLTQIPSRLSDIALFVPPSEPRIAEYLRREGVAVRGDSVTWRGTTVDLRRGAMILREGAVTIICGKPKLEPIMGQASFALFDELGRAVRARTAPFTTGSSTVSVR